MSTEIALFWERPLDRLEGDFLAESSLSDPNISAMSSSSVSNKDMVTGNGVFSFAQSMHITT